MTQAEMFEHFRRVAPTAKPEEFQRVVENEVVHADTFKLCDAQEALSYTLRALIRWYEEDVTETLADFPHIAASYRQAYVYARMLRFVDESLIRAVDTRREDTKRVYIGLDGHIYLRGPLDVLLWRSPWRADNALHAGLNALDKREKG